MYNENNETHPLPEMNRPLSNNSASYNHTPTDPTEHVIPKKSPKKRWYFKLTAFVLLLTFISGFTFGAGYLTASYYGSVLPGAQNITATPTLGVEDSGAKITQVQSIVTNGTSPTTIAAIAHEVSPAIVTIASYSAQTPNGFFGNSGGFYGGTGSGIIFDTDENELLIVTNYHVIEGASNLEVIFSNGSKIQAQALGYNSRMDIAVLSVPMDQVNANLDNIVISTFGDSDQVQVGELAVAIGNPLGPEYALTVTSGIISALGRDISIDQNTTQVNLIQTDAAINPGNSGGALLNAEGNVIGINSAKYVDESVEGIGFAIPINDAKESIDAILESRSGTDLAYELAEDRAFLGVQISDITSEINLETGMAFGVYITGTFEGSGAHEVGIQVGDIIYGINGDRISNVQELFAVLENAKVGDVVDIQVVRNNGLLEFSAPLYSYKEVMKNQ